MARFMRDTDTCSYSMRGHKETVLQRSKGFSSEARCISVITKCELLLAVEVYSDRDKVFAPIRTFLHNVSVLDFPDAAAVHYADIRANLKRRGQMIGANGLFLAAHARCLGLTLVTNNTREFSRVEGLKIENWVA